MQIEHNMEQVGRDLGQLIARYAKRAMLDIDIEMLNQADLLYDDIIRGSPVDEGLFIAEWEEPLKWDYAYYAVINESPYGMVIEKGGYRGVGPLTARGGPLTLAGGIQVPAGIYPTQKPIGVVAQAMSKRNTEVREALAKVLKV